MLHHEKPSDCSPPCRMLPARLLCCALLLCLDNPFCCALTSKVQQLLD